LAESSTGKSYIPLELSGLFPSEDVIKLGYASPTSFFHDWGTLVTDPSDDRDVPEEKKRKTTHIERVRKSWTFWINRMINSYNVSDHYLAMTKGK
jgi:hypothetical protein